MKIITIASLKGGVGKTAITIFLAQAISSNATRKRVLCVDLDHNNNLTDYMLRHTAIDELEERNVYHVLNGTASAKDCVYATEFGCDVLPCTIQLNKIGNELARDPGSLLRFGPQLKQMNYDFILIDTPPSLSYELSAGLYAATLVLSPVAYSRWTAQGYGLLSDEITGIAEAIGKKPDILAVPALVTASQAERLKLTKFARFSKAIIHKSAAIKNACDRAKAIKIDSKSFGQFAALAREVLR
ncbi:MAG: AAA family ATPase [Leptospiraceae bacterium]|nr:AAA family ATPase [Leptospiraceae bacterium]MCB1314559.1 AAA family ATPase [Leptospiraceae bacterium]